MLRYVHLSAGIKDMRHYTQLKLIFNSFGYETEFVYIAQGMLGVQFSSWTSC